MADQYVEETNPLDFEGAVKMAVIQCLRSGLTSKQALKKIYSEYPEVSKPKVKQWIDDLARDFYGIERTTD